MPAKGQTSKELIPCTICGKPYKSRGGMRNHRLWVHGGAIKNGEGNETGESSQTPANGNSDPATEETGEAVDQGAIGLSPDPPPVSQSEPETDVYVCGNCRHKPIEYGAPNCPICRERLIWK